MAFGLLYMLMALIGKAGSDIKYNLDRISAREYAKEKGNDTYIDGRGITRTVDGNKAVSFYRNDRGETRLLDKHGDTVKIYNEKKDEEYSNVTVKYCVDKYGNQESCSKIPRHKNCSFEGKKLIDLTTGKYLTLRKLYLENDYKLIGDRLYNRGKLHYFYVDPMTLNIVRESDGEAELRKQGYKNIPSIETINTFIINYNKKQKERYEPKDIEGVHCGSITDLNMEAINKLIWKQNNKEKEI